jgi:D-psicose/D-tagatose/L-ribulose 3-epimerase
MTRFSLHLALWTRDWSDDVVPFGARAALLGYDGVELSLLGSAANSPDVVGRALADLGLGVTATYGLSRSEDIGSPDASVRARGVEALKRAARATRALGSDLLSGVICAPWGLTGGLAKQDRLARAADGLREAASTAQEVGVRLAVEAINRFESDLVNTADETIALVDRVDADNVGILLDSFHMNIEEPDPPSAIRAAGRRLFHFHCVDNDRGAPGGGRIDFAAQARALAEIGYQGWITAEMFVVPEVVVSPDLSIWRHIESSPDAAAIAAIEFMKTTFAA